MDKMDKFGYHIKLFSGIKYNFELLGYNKNPRGIE